MNELELLAALPNEYRPIIIRLGNSGTPISGDCIKTKLLQDIKFESHGKGIEHYSNPSCFNCSKLRHIASKCKKPNRRHKNKSLKTSIECRTFHLFIVSNVTDANSWYIVSEASNHMSHVRIRFFKLENIPPMKIRVVNSNKLFASGKDIIKKRKF